MGRGEYFGFEGVWDDDGGEVEGETLLGGSEWEDV